MLKGLYFFFDIVFFCLWVLFFEFSLYIGDLFEEVLSYYEFVVNWERIFLYDIKVKNEIN